LFIDDAVHSASTLMAAAPGGTLRRRSFGAFRRRAAHETALKMPALLMRRRLFRKLMFCFITVSSIDFDAMKPRRLPPLGGLLFRS